MAFISFSVNPNTTMNPLLVRRPHSVSSPYPGKFPLPVFRPAARPTSGTTYSRPRKKSSAGRYDRPRRQERYSPRPHSCSTPSGLGCLPVSSAPVSCGRGNRPACAPRTAIACINFLSCVPPFPCCRSPRKGFLPHSCGVFRRWHAPRTSGHFVPKLARCGASPAGIFLFGRSSCFQGAVHR